MPLIYVDPNTLRIQVQTDLKSPFIPSEKTIAIEKFAEAIKMDLNRYLEDVYNPKVDKLMELVMSYNAEFNPEVAKQWEKMKKEKEERTKKGGDKSTKPALKVTETGKAPKKFQATKKKSKKKKSS